MVRHTNNSPKALAACGIYWLVKPVPLPGIESAEGEVTMTINPSNAYELALQETKKHGPDWRKISDLLEHAHSDGDKRATYALATWHLAGEHGYPKNLKNANNLLKIAAKANIASAHFDLAVSYETGQGIKKSEVLAFRHYVAAALSGDNQAFSEVGRCLYYGIGVNRDTKLAKIWLDKADSLGVDVR